MASYLVLLFLLATVNFLLPRAMPGDPIRAMASATPSGALGEPQRAALAHTYGLDRPLGEQYLRYLGGLARGDLGFSISRNRPVGGLIAERLPWTLLLAVTALVLATVVGVAGGVRSGWRRRGGSDDALLTVVVGSWSLPPFFVGSLVLFVFAATLKWFPLSGATSAFSTASGLARGADIAHHLVLPAMTLAAVLVAPPYLVMRAGMATEAGADHLLLGRAKGLPDRRLKYSYAARNALLPVVTTTALSLGASVSGGVVFIENVFAYRGIGQLLIESSRARDYPAMQGCFLVLGLVFVSVNLVTEVVYPMLDPRASS